MHSEVVNEARIQTQGGIGLLIWGKILDSSQTRTANWRFQVPTIGGTQPSYCRDTDAEIQV